VRNGTRGEREKSDPPSSLPFWQDLRLRSAVGMDAKRSLLSNPLWKRLTYAEFDQARRRALAFAKRRTRSNTKAEDLVDRGIAACFDPDESPWDPETEPDFAVHLLWVVDNRVPAELRKEVRRNDTGWQTNAADALHPPPRTPEERVGEAEQKMLDAAVVEDTVAELRRAGHERPARVLEVWREEIDDAEEQARVLGCTVAEVHRAREVVRRYMRKRKKSES